MVMHQGGSWACGLCSKRNAGEDSRCCVCGRPKPADPTPRSQAPKKEGIADDDGKPEGGNVEEGDEKLQHMNKIKAEYKQFVQTKMRLDK